MTTPTLSDHVVSVSSQHSVAETVARLRGLIAAKGMLEFALIDFHADAARAGLAMRSAQLLVFGNPRGGTPIMQANPTAALDLPLKVLVWQQEDGTVWISYNAPTYMQSRHHLPDALMGPLNGIALLVKEATQ